jgi:hypothetical protein
MQVRATDRETAASTLEVENYPGQIEWYRYRDDHGRLYRFGFIELTDDAGQRFWGGANRQYRLVVLQDINGIGAAYPFETSNGHGGDFLTPEYVYEKLGRALYFRRDVQSFTQALGRLLGRPTPNGKGRRL